MSHPSRAHLDAIGIPVWVRRRAARAPSRAGVPHEAAATGAPPPPAPHPADASHRATGSDIPRAAAAAVVGAIDAPAPATAVVGAIDAPAPAAAVVGTIDAPAPAAAMVGTIDAPAPAAAVLEAIDAQVRACRKCELHRTRTNTVFGVGPPGAGCMFIGEAPGAEEDARGEPFVGRAGRLLDAMLAAIGLRRGDVYIANIVKCRPPRNRDPQAGEIEACSGYLRRQIEAVSPRLLVAAGRVAAQSLLSTTQSIGRLRGRTFRYGEDRLPVVVMYHPAYFLRSPLEKRKAWDDLVRLRSMLSEEAESVQ